MFIIIFLPSFKIHYIRKLINFDIFGIQLARSIYSKNKQGTQKILYLNFRIPFIFVWELKIYLYTVFLIIIFF